MEKKTIRIGYKESEVVQKVIGRQELLAPDEEKFYDEGAEEVQKLTEKLKNS